MKKITFKSSNKKVATVTSKGVVKGLEKGTATITVQSGSEKMTCKVTVGNNKMKGLLFAATNKV